MIDEAPGVRPEIYQAIEGIRASGDVRVLALGNPTFGVISTIAGNGNLGASEDGGPASAV